MECDNFLHKQSWKSIPYESRIAGRAGIAGIIVIDSDGLWTFIQEWNDFCSI